jgi:para-nitrobenzyl esterase
VTEALLETKYGTLRGVVEDGVRVFRGVPYGASTAGARRFLPPAPPKPWAGVRDALAWAATCPGGTAEPLGAMSHSEVFLSMFGAGIAASPTPIASEPPSEDCLKLHVFTPSLGDGGKRPVMVWMHGGGFITGSAIGVRTDGGYLARHGDVVVVTVHHRLGALGYAHLGELFGDEYVDSGNAGQLDLVAALQWVHDHADAIGADAGNVTVFGESGGGGKVACMLAMPSAATLCHRGIIQSGFGTQMTERDVAAECAAALLSELGLTAKDLAKLQTLPAPQIRDAEARAAAAIGGSPFGLFRPVAGLPSLPAHPFDPVVAASARDKRVLVGCTREETSSLMSADPTLETLTEDDVRARVAQRFPYQTDDILQTYRKVMPSNATPTELWIWFTSAATRTESITIAERKAIDGTTPAWMYLFEWRSPAADGRVRAAHGLDTPFMFGSASKIVANAGADEPGLTATMSSAWLAFARTGDPSPPDLPWPSYDLESRSTMVFDAHNQVVDDPYAEERLLWERLGASSSNGS